MEFFSLLDTVAAPLARCGAPVQAVVEELRGAPAMIWPAQAPRTKSEVAALIDHTLLRADATAAEVRQLCAEARGYGTASVCVNPSRVALAYAELRGGNVPVCAVVGFPLGASTTEAKRLEAALAIRAGARELDMVIDIGALKDADYAGVYRDIAGVVERCHAHDARVKVIIEACLLTDAEKLAACVLSQAAGADFVKTSTGFSRSGAAAADVALMRRVVGLKLGVKAAGGIRTLADLRAMVEAGASRIGASATRAMVEAAE